MRAIILAAGRGSRMGRETDERPKCLLELDGRPLLEWQMHALRAAGLDEVGIVRGYRGELLEGRAERLFDNPRWRESNMVSSLACAAEWLREAPCLVSYADIFYAPQTPAALVPADGDVAIAYDPRWRELWERRFADPLDDAESFRLDRDGWLVEVGRRPGCVEEIEGQYMGLLRFTPAGWAAAERVRAELSGERRERLDMTSLLDLMLARGVRVRAVACAGEWGEVDRVEDLALYRAEAGARQSP
jgi:choline kinase